MKKATRTSTENIDVPCKVCGDKSSGKNYKVHTCESCKTFFKRTSINFHKLKCPKSNNCPIDFATRKCCAKCRFEKCIAVGMKCKLPKVLKVTQTVTKPTHNSILEAKIANLPPNSVIISNVKISSDKYVDDYLRRHSPMLETEKSELLESICSRKRNYATDLTRYEWQLIEEVQLAMEASFPDERTLPVVGQYTNLQQTWNYPANYSRTIVSFCRKMSAFNWIKPEDQLIILKPFYMELLGFRLIFIADDDMKSCLVYANPSATEAVQVTNKIDDEVKKIVPEEQYNESVNTAKMLKNEMENDTIIRDLLIAYCLFRPRDHLIGREFVRYLHRIYAKLVLRYFEHKYKNAKLASRKYSKLVNLISTLDTLREKGKAIFNEIDTSTFSDLIRELYDIA